jgi:hypothetical protein
MAKKNKDELENINPVHKEWLVAVLKQDIEQPKIWSEKEIDSIGPTKPKSKLQGFLQDIYETLLEAQTARTATLVDTGRGDLEMIGLPSEDYFDKWYENEDIESYNQKYKLLTALNGIANSIGKSGASDYNETGFQEVLATLAQAVIEEPESIMGIAEHINSLYPGLAEEPMKYIPPEAMNEHEQQLYDQAVAQIEESVETNVEKHLSKLREIQDAAKTDFEEIAQTLNKAIIFGEEFWELTLYALMSPRAPKIQISGMEHRANIHYLLAGDISTAKSKILTVCERVSPKALIVDETTKASLEGVAPLGKGDEIADGILDHARDGNIIIEELTNNFAKMPLWRRAMDCKYIQIFKKGIPKGIDVNTTVLAACNPTEDFYNIEDLFRDQIGFKEGVLSRFDVLIPLTATTTTNKVLIDKLVLFGSATEDFDLSKIKKRLSLIASGMDTIKKVVITDEQQDLIRNVFKEKNKRDERERLLKRRPLVLLRDLETLLRLVNVIASVNFSRRTVEDGVLSASDEDVAKAIALWETLLHIRVQLYASQISPTRMFYSTGDEIVKFIAYATKANNSETVLVKDVMLEIVGNQQLVSEATFYREIQNMRAEGRIFTKFKRNMQVGLVIAD